MKMSYDNYAFTSTSPPTKLIPNASVDVSTATVASVVMSCQHIYDELQLTDLDSTSNKSAIITNATTNDVDDLLDLNSIIDNRLIATQTQFGKINEYFFKLKYLCSNKPQYQSQLLMLNTLFKLKYQNIRENYLFNLKQFDVAVTNGSVTYSSSSKESLFNSSIDDSLNYTLNKKRQQQQQQRGRQRTKSLNFLNICKSCSTTRTSSPSNYNELFLSNNNNNAKPHKNYFQIERDMLEYKYEQILWSLNNEILQSIKSIYIQMKCENEKQKRVQRHVQQQQQQQQALSDESVSFHQFKRHIYSTEKPIERRIKRKKHQNSRLPSTTHSDQPQQQMPTFLQIPTSNIIQLSNESFMRYRNANAKETPV